MTLAFPMMAVVKRELLTHMRNYRLFIALALLVFVAAFVMTANWPRSGQIASSVSAQRARLLMIFFSMVLLGGAGLMVPALSSSAFVTEKERDTFDLLKLTLVRPSGLIIAKLCNTLGLFMLMVIGTMPIFGAVFFLVGLDLLPVIQAFIVIIACTVSGAMTGMFCSAWFRRIIPATIVGFLMTAFFMGGWYVVAFTLAEITGFSRVRAVRNILEYATMFTCPIAGVIEILDGGGYRGISELQLFIGSVIYHVILALIMFYLTLRLVRRPLKPPKTSKAKPIDDPEHLLKRRKKFPYYLIDPLRRKKPIEDQRNPVLVKELRYGMAQRATNMIRLFYVAFIVCMLASFPVVIETIRSSAYWRPNFDESVIVMFAFETIFTIVMAPIFLASAFTKERELGNIDMLRMTLLTPGNIVVGKIVAGVIALSPMLVASIISSVVVALCIRFSMVGLATVMIGFVSLLVCVLVVISISLFSSVMSRHTTTALVASYLIGIMVFGGFSGLLFFLYESRFVSGGQSPELEAFLASFSPLISLCWFAQLREFRNLPYWFFSMFWFTVGSLCLIAFSVFKFSRQRT